MRKCIFTFLICLLTCNIKAQQFDSDLFRTSVLVTMDFAKSDVETNSITSASDNNNSELNTTISKNPTEIETPNSQYIEKPVKLVKAKEEIKSFLKTINGFIINSHNNTPIPEATLRVFYDTEEIYKTINTDDEGFFEMEVPINNQLFIEAKHEKFNVRYKKIVYFDQNESDFFRIYLIPKSKKKKRVKKIKKEKYKAIDLLNIPIKSRKTKQGKLILDTPELFFDIDEFKLRGIKNVNKINEIVKILVENPDLVLEISTHTDSRGPKNYLLDLSKRRAESIQSLFLKKGIESNRVEIKANGASELLNDCDTKEKCSDRKHLLNKRTEFVVLNPNKSKR